MDHAVVKIDYLELDTQGFREQMLGYMEDPELFGTAACVPFFGADWDRLHARVITGWQGVLGDLQSWFRRQV